MGWKLHSNPDLEGWKWLKWDICCFSVPSIMSLPIETETKRFSWEIQHHIKSLVSCSPFAVSEKASFAQSHAA